MELTYSKLNGEYLNWSLINGDGRNEDGLRFAQHIDHIYDVPHSWMVLIFYIHSCERVYSELLKRLYELEYEK
tara:strand:- start:854 stop:1072 length:219 start_codon:yes stop_codon:yes gene_type:complete